MDTSKWKKLVIPVVISIVILIIGFLIFKLIYKDKTPKPLKPLYESPKPTYHGNVTFEDLEKINVPEPGEKVKEGIAIPKESVSLSPTTENKLRNFELKGENDVLYPKEFIVYQNDIVNIKLTAVDKNYDFFLEGYNLEIKANKGEMKRIELQAINLGIYNFYCYLCSTKEKPAGKIIVVPRK